MPVAKRENIDGELPEITNKGNANESKKINKPEVNKEHTEVIKEDTEVKAKPKEKLFKIIIDEQAGPDAHEDVFVGVNGKHYLIKRGHEVVVPEGVVNVLRESITAKIIKHEDGTEEIKHIPRIAFRVLGEVTKNG